MGRLYLVDRDGDYLSIWEVYVEHNRYVAGDVIFSTDPLTDFKNHGRAAYEYLEDENLHLDTTIIAEFFEGSITPHFIFGKFK